MRLPLDVRVALFPFETYRELVAEPVRGSWRRALERPALVAVIVGTAVTMSSAGRVPLGLVVMGIVCWSFVPLIQWVIGMLVISRATGRPVSMPRCLELLFLSHLPWSLWIIARTGVSAFTPFFIGRAVEVASLAVPGIWTTVIVFAFCRAVLGCADTRAHVLTVTHQMLTWATVFVYAFFATGVWARVLALVGA